MQFIFLLSNLDGLRLAIENFLKFFYDFFYDLGTRMAAILTYSQPFAPIRSYSQILRIANKIANVREFWTYYFWAVLYFNC